MKRPSIFIVSTEFAPGPGGIGSHAYQVAKELHNLGWEVTVFTEQANCPEEEIIAFNNSSPFKVNRLYPTPSVALLLKKFLKIFFTAFFRRPDLVMGTGKHGSWFAVLAGKLALVKTVVIGHGTEFISEMSPRSRRLNDWVYSSANGIVYVSHYTRKLAENAGIKNRAPFVIHNGADGTAFYPLPADEIQAFKTSMGLLDKKVIITVGNVQPRKGHEFVIRALPQILKQVPNAHYYCIGPPSIKTQLEGIATELEVNNHVHFTGRILNTELIQWLNACDVFALTSVVTEYGDVEGFGIVIVEAALCKKPAVVTGDSGPGEAIIAGETGLGVGERNVDEIATAMVNLLSNDIRRKEMGEKAHTNARNNLTWSNVVKKYDTALKSLLK